MNYFTRSVRSGMTSQWVLNALRETQHLWWDYMKSYTELTGYRLHSPRYLTHYKNIGMLTVKHIYIWFLKCLSIRLFVHVDYVLVFPAKMQIWMLNSLTLTLKYTERTCPIRTNSSGIFQCQRGRLCPSPLPLQIISSADIVYVGFTNNFLQQVCNITTECKWSR